MSLFFILIFIACIYIGWRLRGGYEACKGKADKVLTNLKKEDNKEEHL